MFCNKCGNPMNETDNFCQKCGQPRIVIATAQPVPVAPQPTIANAQPVPTTEGKKQPKSRKKMAILISSIAAVLVLVLVAALVLPMLLQDGPETIYVRTQVTQYDVNGICISRTEYTYDDMAQLLQEECYQIEYITKYDPYLDAYISTYDENSPLKKDNSLKVEYEYDEQGNCTLHDRQMGSYVGDIQWDYEDDMPQSFRWTALTDKNIYNDYRVNYDGENVTSISYEYYDRERYSVLWEYDDEGRLIREFTCSVTRDATEKLYYYENDQLVEVELRSGFGLYELYDNAWEDVMSTRYTHHFEYDKDGNLVRLTTRDHNGDRYSDRRISYDRNGYPAEMECTQYGNGRKTQETVRYTCDENGNIVKIQYEDGSYVEYEYEAREVSRQQASNYRSRMAISGYSNEMYHEASPLISAGYAIVYSNLIPNPLFQMPYLDLIA